MTADRELLAGYVEAWQVSVDDVVTLLHGLGDEDWARPTDLAGWDVRSVACHLAHIESLLAGMDQPGDAAADLEQLTRVSSTFTEAGVVARASRSHEQVLGELVEATGRRLQELRTDPPTEAAGAPPLTPGGARWSWETLLSNRVVDVWMHGQDIRRAVGRPGGLDGPGAAHTVAVFAGGFGYVVGKRVSPQAGTTVQLQVTGEQPRRLVVTVDDNGRAVPAPDEAAADATLRLDTEGFVVLSGGRRSPDAMHVEVSGDTGLCRRVLEAMALTP